MSVDIYSHAWMDDPIVKGVIVESGASTMCGLDTNASQTNWPKVADSLGCSDTATQLDCMRSKSLTEIIDGVESLGTGYPPTFVPMPDGKVVFDNYPSRMAQGQFIKVPMIIGSNDREVFGDTHATLQEFTCPVKQLVESRRAYGVPAWRYRYFGGGPGPASSVPADPFTVEGFTGPAVHGSEIFHVFDTRGRVGNLSPLFPQTPQTVAVAKQFQTVWSAFAKDPQEGPTKHGWPLYDPKGELFRTILGNESDLTQETRSSI